MCSRQNAWVLFWALVALCVSRGDARVVSQRQPAQPQNHMTGSVKEQTVSVGAMVDDVVSGVMLRTAQGLARMNISSSTIASNIKRREQQLEKASLTQPYKKRSYADQKAAALQYRQKDRKKSTQRTKRRASQRPEAEAEAGALPESTAATISSVSAAVASSAIKFASSVQEQSQTAASAPPEAVSKTTKSVNNAKSASGARAALSSSTDLLSNAARMQEKVKTKLKNLNI